MAQGIILSLGSVNADYQVRVDQKPGSTTTMLGHDFLRLSGGKGANVAFLARRLEVAASLIAHVGNDDLKEQALGALRDMGVDLSHVRAIDQVATGVSMIAVPKDGKKQIILAPNANDAWQEEDSEEVAAAIQQAPAGSVLVVDYEVAPFIVDSAIQAAHEKGFRIILDPSPTDRVNRDLFAKLHYLVPDASETEGLTGIRPDSVDKAAQAARQLLEQGLETVLVKLEEGGCLAANEGTCLHVPPLPIDVVDTTGAGDAFAGALAVAVLEKRPLQEAACFASAASLATTTGYGSQPAYPDRDQIRHFYAQTIDKVRKL
ncbi:ribokinase [Pontibacter ummariensis]|uniref:Ribokinase n=1 Tax=Pontibacter ummariensis TaxID=1610492 RepID=A0A239KH00_9BACT|nr:ribokinase [Pontibacter ummariensis]PRY06422.1 ribokinase [Pontibacter ummariensis]SNT16972.1 ribokinase [Pontibacter ummariensis]